MKRVLFFVAMLLQVNCVLAAPELNQLAPDFTLPDADGKTHKLSDYRGKIVVLEWTNPDCPFVTRHYNKKTMTTLAQKYGGKNVAWLAIDSSNYNTTDRSRQWAKENNIAYPILQDTDGKVGRLYGAKTTPHMYVINPYGKLVYKGGIDNDSWGMKRGNDLVNYVDKTLEALLAGNSPTPHETKPYGCSVKY